MQQGPGPRPFDVTPRDLIEGDPAGWLTWVGLPVNGRVQAIDSELSTVLAEVDKVLRIDAPTPWLAHFEIQSTRDPELPFRLLQYYALLLRRHRHRLESIVVLLRPSADGPELTGHFEWRGATDDLTVQFRFRVIRLWERPVEELLTGSLGVLPLAPLAAVERADLPAVFHRVSDRLTRDADPDRADLLWAAMTLLLDLRYDRESIRGILREMRSFRDSIAYQILVEEGREEGLEQGREQGLEQGREQGLEQGREQGREQGIEQGREQGSLMHARRILLDLGADRLGPPDLATRDRVESIGDVATLDGLIRRVIGASSWQDLLASE